MDLALASLNFTIMETDGTKFPRRHESSPDIGGLTPHCCGFHTFDKINALDAFVDGKMHPQELPTEPKQRAAHSQHFGKSHSL